MKNSVMIVCAAFALTCSTAWAQLDLTHQYIFNTNNGVGGSYNDLIGSLNGTPGAGVTLDPTLGAVFDGSSALNSVINFGSNDIAATAGANGTSSGLSIEFWGRFNWNGDDANVFNIGSGASGNGLTQWAGNGIHIYAQASGSNGSYDNWTPTGLAPLSNWGSGPNIDVVDVFNQADNTIKMYLNGSLYETGSLGGVSLANISSVMFNLGGGPAFPDNGSGVLEGSMTAFRIYATALNSSQITALDAAGPDVVPTINARSSAQSGSWLAGTTWTPSSSPDSTCLVTVSNPVTLSAATGNALGLTVNTGGTVTITTGGTLNVAGAVSFNGGGVKVDGTSTLNVATLDAATSTGLVAASGATINIIQTLTADGPLTLTGVNLSTNGVSVPSGTFSTSSFGSFQITGGPMTVGAGTFNLTQGTSTVSGIAFTGNGQLNIEGPASSSLTVTGNNSGIIDLNNQGSISLLGGSLNVAAWTRIGHDGGSGQLTVSGSNAAFSSNQDVQMGFNGASGNLVVSNGATFTSGSITAGTAWISNTEIQVNNATMNVGNISLGDSNFVGSQIDYSSLVVSNSASLTLGGLTVGNQVGSQGILFAKVEQTSGIVSVGGSMTLANYNDNTGTMVGTYNLRGGTLAVNQIVGPQSGQNTGSSAVVNFNGGTLQATTSGSILPANANLTVTIQAGGLTVDTAGQNISIDQPLLAPSGYGIGSVTVTNFGSYLVAPYVQFAGGSGSGATGEAVLNADGTINHIDVTNPGSGFQAGDSVTVNLLTNRNYSQGGGSATATITAGPLVGGGLTTTGSGTLTLTASNSYTGPTNVNLGTLALGAAGSINATSAINVAAGATFDVTAQNASPFTVPSGATLANSGTVLGSVTVPAGTTLGGAGSFLQGSGGACSVTVGGILQPGGGTMTIGANGSPVALDLQAGSNYAWGATSAASGDMVQVNGDLSITGSVVVNPVSLGFNPTGHAYTIMTWTGSAPSGTLVVGAGIPPSGQAHWVDGPTGNWDVAANWNLATVGGGTITEHVNVGGGGYFQISNLSIVQSTPGAANDVVIARSDGVAVTGPAAATTVNSLTLGNGTDATSLTVQTSGPLTVTNGVTMNNNSTLGGPGAVGAASFTSTGTANLNGGVTVNANTAAISGTLNLNTAALNAANGATLANNSTLTGPGTLLSGTLTTNGLATLNGGVTVAANTFALSGTVDFNGGTLQATGSSSNFASGANLVVQAGGAAINTNGYAVTLNQTLSHDPTLAGTDGGLTKSGAGTLVVTASQAYNGPTIVRAGTLQLPGPAPVISSMDLSVGGAPGIAGSYALTGDSLTITGGGNDIWGGTEQGQYVYTTVPTNANFDVAVHVASMTGGDSAWAKAGILARADNSSNQVPCVFDCQTTGNGVAMQGELDQAQYAAAGGISPNWIRMTYTASTDTFTGYYSNSSGPTVPTSWTEIQSYPAVMTGTSFLLGIADTAHDNSTTDTAVFDNLGTLGSLFAAPPAPLPVTTALSIAAGATLDVNGVSQQVGSLSGAGLLTNSSNSPAVFTAGNSTSTIFSGSIADNGNGGLSLVKVGDGTLVLGGSDTYSGTTTIEAGTLTITTATALPTGTSLTVGAGGTFVFDPEASASPLASNTAIGMASGAAIATVPEPGTLLLLLAAALVAASAIWRRQKMAN